MSDMASITVALRTRKGIYVFESATDERFLRITVLLESVMSEFTALDPQEGPTVWAKRTGNYTVKVVEGTDPENPTKEYILSNNEIERLQDI